MGSARHSRMQARLRQVRRGAAMARPELRQATSEAREFTAGPTAAAIKQTDARTRALIDAFLARRENAGPAACAAGAP